MFLLGSKIFLTAVPDQIIRRGNAILEFEFPREMRDLFKTKPKGDGFHRLKSFEHPASLNQPLFIQPILRAAPKMGMSITT